MHTDTHTPAPISRGREGGRTPHFHSGRPTMTSLICRQTIKLSYTCTHNTTHSRGNRQLRRKIGNESACVSMGARVSVSACEYLGHRRWQSPRHHRLARQCQSPRRREVNIEINFCFDQIIGADPRKYIETNLNEYGYQEKEKKNSKYTKTQNSSDLTP